MTAHPAISAGASFMPISPIGAFHGMIAPVTPTGSCTTSPNPPRAGLAAPPRRTCLPARVIVERRRGTGRRPAGDGVQHPRLARPDLADIVRTQPDLGCDRPQVLRAPRVGQPRPGTAVKRLPGRADRSGDIGGLRLSDAEVQLLARRFDHVDHGAGGGHHPFPADEEPVRMPDRCLNANLVRQAHRILRSQPRTASDLGSHTVTTKLEPTGAAAKKPTGQAARR